MELGAHVVSFCLRLQYVLAWCCYCFLSLFNILILFSEINFFALTSIF